MTWVQDIWARSGRQLRRLGGFLFAALVIGFGVEWLATSNARMILVQPAAINDLALSPDGEVIAIAYANGVVELRETGHARRLIRRIESVRAPIMDVHLDGATAVGLRLTMAHADGRISIETATDGQKLSDALTFTQSLLTPQFKVAEDGAIWAHGINEQGAWIGRLEPDGNFAQPIGMGETGSSKMTLLSATSERAHIVSDTVHTIWTAPIEQTNAPTEPEEDSPPAPASITPLATGAPGIIERVPLGEGYVTTQDDHVLASVNGGWRTATEFFVEQDSTFDLSLPMRDQIGGVTIYGGGAQGEGTTASGEPFNSSALTAAHMTLPFDSQIAVTNLNNNQSVVLRVNDRGPFEDGQIVGVTAVGAMQLGLVGSTVESGPPRVRLKVLRTGGETPDANSFGPEQLETISRELSVQRDGALTAAVFSNNGEKVATAAEDSSAILWSADTFLEIGPLVGHTEGVLDIQFSPDDARVLTGSRDGTARVWNAQTLQEIATLSGHEGSVQSAIFSNSGGLIATFDDADRIRVFDGATYELIDEIADPSNAVASPVMSLDFSPDDQHLLVGYIDDAVTAWSMRSGRLVYQFKHFGASINSVEYSRDGSQILLADSGGRILIRTLGDEDATSNATLNLIAQVPGQFGAQSAKFSPDESQILSLESDGSLRIWDATLRDQAAGDEISTLTTSESFTVSADYSPDGARILVADQDGKASIFTETAPNIWQLARVGDNCRSDDGVAHLQRSGTGEAQSLWMWSKDTWLCELSFDENMLSWVYALPSNTTTVKMLPRGDDGPVTALLLGRADGTVEHRTVQTERIHAVYRGHGGPITQIETVDVGGTLRAAIAAADGSVQIVDLPNGEPSLFAKTNTDMNGFLFGLNELRANLIDMVTLAPPPDEANEGVPEPNEPTPDLSQAQQEETNPPRIADEPASAPEDETAIIEDTTEETTAFYYYAPGNLLPGTGTGYSENTVFAPDMVFPIKDAPVSVQSMVYRPGGAVGGDQCDPTNYHPIWRDNFCEQRNRANPNPYCESDNISGVITLRVGTEEDCRAMRQQAPADRGMHEVVAVADGMITNIGSYTLTLRGSDRTLYTYRHLNMRRLGVSVGDEVLAGDFIGYVSNDFGGTPTTFHLSFEMRQDFEGQGYASVPPYMSLVRAYERREGIRGRQVSEAPPLDQESDASEDPLPPGAETVVVDITERDVWGMATGADMVGSYEIYLERYPDGEFRDEALARIEALTADTAREDDPSATSE